MENGTRQKQEKENLILTNPQEWRHPYKISI